MTLYEMIRFDEGEKLTLYKDTEGYYTIGVGHLVTKGSYSDALKIIPNGASGITRQQSQELFNQDVSKALQAIQSSTLKDTYNRLDEVRRMALVNMVFQLGLTGVLGFRKFINYLNKGEYTNAAAEALDSKWARQTPNRAVRVTNVFKTGTLAGYK